MRALHIKLLRNLWSMKGQGLAIAAVIATGVAMFVMSLTALESLYLSQHSVYRSQQFADIFASVKRAPGALAQRVRELPGVALVETRVQAPLRIQITDFAEPVTGIAISIPNGKQPELNRLFLATLSVGGGEQRDAPLTIKSPITGVVLSRQRQSEGTVQPGEPLLVLGDLDNLEVEVDLLSPDAVRLRPGMRVELERWGGDGILPGRVRRIDPAGFTRYSALGVEEQRVWVIVDIDAEREQWQHLGDAYRVEARFILWEGDKILQLPTSALFRDANGWACYVIENGIAKRRSMNPGSRSGLQTEINDGLQEGERVLLYPGQDIVEGTRVRLR